MRIAWDLERRFTPVETTATLSLLLAERNLFSSTCLLNIMQHPEHGIRAIDGINSKGLSSSGRSGGRFLTWVYIVWKADRQILGRLSKQLFNNTHPAHKCLEFPRLITEVSVTLGGGRPNTQFPSNIHLAHTCSELSRSITDVYVALGGGRMFA